MTTAHDVDETRPAEAMAPRSRRSPRGIVVGAFVLAAIFAISPMRIVGDSQLVFADAHSMLYDRDLDLTEFADAPAVSGAYSYTHTNGGAYDYFPWMSAVLAVPVVAGLDVAHAVGIGRGSWAMIRADAPVLDDYQELVASLVAAATAALLAATGLRLAERRRRAQGRTLDLGWKGRAATVLAVGLSTPLWSTVSRTLWQHTPADLALAVLMAAATTAAEADQSDPTRSDRRWSLAAGVAAVVMIWSRPAAAGVALVVLAALLIRTRSRRVRRITVLAAGATGAVLLAANLLLLNTWRPPYLAGGRMEIGHEYLEAVAANLVSPARGAIIFSSVVFLGALVAWRQGGSLRWWATASACGTVAALLSVSAYAFQWWGGLTYGPRFMIEGILVLVPVAVAGGVELVAARAPNDGTGRHTMRHPTMGRIAMVLLVVSMGLHGIGAWSRSAWEWNRVPDDIDQHPGRVWSWTDPPFLRPFGTGDQR